MYWGYIPGHPPTRMQKPKYSSSVLGFHFHHLHGRKKHKANDWKGSSAARRQPDEISGHNQAFKLGRGKATKKHVPQACFDILEWASKGGGTYPNSSLYRAWCIEGQSRMLCGWTINQPGSHKYSTLELSENGL